MDQDGETTPTLKFSNFVTSAVKKNSSKQSNLLGRSNSVTQIHSDSNSKEQGFSSQAAQASRLEQTKVGADWKSGRQTAQDKIDQRDNMTYML